MKISNTQYASALYESAKGKSQSEINEIVANFVKVLAKNNQIKNINSIISKFRDIWNKEEGIVEAEVASREKLDRELRVEIEKFVGKKYNTKNVEIKSIIDSDIKGGIIVRVGDEVMDGSVERQLADLKKKLES
ncbi:MAG: ATP synthase F1 subunit delta [Parcubacteria group bacterium]|jgi:F-type H+-transporting ATPase subunit delta